MNYPAEIRHCCGCERSPASDPGRVAGENVQRLERNLARRPRCETAQRGMADRRAARGIARRRRCLHRRQRDGVSHAHRLSRRMGRARSSIRRISSRSAGAFRRRSGRLRLSVRRGPANAKRKRERVVVSFSGDGGFVMTCQELATAARYHLRMIVIIHNDSAYGAIKHLQRIRCEARFRDTDLNNPDFLQLAAAFGIPARQLPPPPSLPAALREAITTTGPVCHRGSRPVALFAALIAPLAV